MLNWVVVSVKKVVCERVLKERVNKVLIRVMSVGCDIWLRLLSKCFLMLIGWIILLGLVCSMVVRLRLLSMIRKIMEIIVLSGLNYFGIF